MKTVKARVCKYDVRTGKKEIVIEEVPVYPEPKPIPSPEQIAIKKLQKQVLELQNQVKELQNQVKELQGKLPSKELTSSLR